MKQLILRPLDGPYVTIKCAICGTMMILAVPVKLDYRCPDCGSKMAEYVILFDGQLKLPVNGPVPPDFW